ncbi:hypothetical protein [Bacillus sp. ISL-47]|uniref:hypothetical protein n=1 Tax=Bacillus sp. ISL-47 TaxID=2819130 RepID=UPI001BE5CB72|nr:hypothetical protein [Bacillus sp. ISL-47]MBT2707068.1 hypothetical protein [Pseudomonas sp. ISL-84]
MSYHVHPPAGPMNLYSYFISSNPSTAFNPNQVWPRISKRSYLSPYSYVAGDVTIQRNVFVAPFVSIRADEGSPFYIGEGTNLQDGVIVHGLKNRYVEKDASKYSIYIGKNVSCTHGSLIHGPCLIEDNVFIGFQAIVYSAVIGEGSFISTNAVVTNGVQLRPHSFVPPGATIDTQVKADSLSGVPKNDAEFAKEVQRVNLEFPAAYSLMFGEIRCSCGLSCSRGRLDNLTDS